MSGIDLRRCDVGGLLRFGVSMDAELLTAFDDLIERKGYANRSEALRDLVRDAIIESQVPEVDTVTSAALCLIHDSGATDPSGKLAELQQNFNRQIVSTLGVQLNARSGLQVLVLRGLASELREFADRARALRGVRRGELVLTGADDDPADRSGE